MKPVIFQIFIFCFSFALFGQSGYEWKKYKKERVYNVCEIDSTQRYYITQTIVCTDSVVLVIDKKSKQLKDKKIKELGSYKFKTYTIYDIISPSSAIYCQMVDHKEIWCETDNKDLHFTDGMGNEYYDYDEDEMKKGK